eukprot:TRINITY_DN2874_c0_g1_i1.p1 TRINITY_DN2874_c0_g1~~TRINITY_DN2874_c0_g1_i1.p1  ORF type:complete len:1449 (-),score=469.51 TRINITY_DN2874_c0_g1_i1:4-4350(-)
MEYSLVCGIYSSPKVDTKDLIQSITMKYKPRLFPILKENILKKGDKNVDIAKYGELIAEYVKEISEQDIIKTYEITLNSVLTFDKDSKDKNLMTPRKGKRAASPKGNKRSDKKRKDKSDSNEVNILSSFNDLPGTNSNYFCCFDLNFEQFSEMQNNFDFLFLIEMENENYWAKILSNIELNIAYEVFSVENEIDTEDIIEAISVAIGNHVFAKKMFDDYLNSSVVITIPSEVIDVSRKEYDDYVEKIKPYEDNVSLILFGIIEQTLYNVGEVDRITIPQPTKNLNIHNFASHLPKSAPQSLHMIEDKILDIYLKHKILANIKTFDEKESLQLEALLAKVSQFVPLASYNIDVDFAETPFANYSTLIMLHLVELGKFLEEKMIDFEMKNIFDTISDRIGMKPFDHKRLALNMLEISKTSSFHHYEFFSNFSKHKIIIDGSNNNVKPSVLEYVTQIPKITLEVVPSFLEFLKMNGDAILQNINATRSNAIEKHKEKVSQELFRLQQEISTVEDENQKASIDMEKLRLMVPIIIDEPQPLNPSSKPLYQGLPENYEFGFKNKIFCPADASEVAITIGNIEKEKCKDVKKSLDESSIVSNGMTLLNILKSGCQLQMIKNSFNMNVGTFNVEVSLIGTEVNEQRIIVRSLQNDFMMINLNDGLISQVCHDDKERIYHTSILNGGYVGIDDLHMFCSGNWRRGNEIVQNDKYGHIQSIENVEEENEKKKVAKTKKEKTKKGKRPSSAQQEVEEIVEVYEKEKFVVEKELRTVEPSKNDVKIKMREDNVVFFETEEVNMIKHLEDVRFNKLKPSAHSDVNLCFNTISLRPKFISFPSDITIVEEVIVEMPGCRAVHHFFSKGIPLGSIIELDDKNRIEIVPFNCLDSYDRTFNHFVCGVSVEGHVLKVDSSGIISYAGCDYENDCAVFLEKYGGHIPNVSWKEPQYGIYRFLYPKLCNSTVTKHIERDEPIIATPPNDFQFQILDWEGICWTVTPSGNVFVGMPELVEEELKKKEDKEEMEEEVVIEKTLEDTKKDLKDGKKKKGKNSKESLKSVDEPIIEEIDETKYFTETSVITKKNDNEQKELPHFRLHSKIFVIDSSGNGFEFLRHKDLIKRLKRMKKTCDSFTIQRTNLNTEVETFVGLTKIKYPESKVEIKDYFDEITEIIPVEFETLKPYKPMIKQVEDKTSLVLMEKYINTFGISEKQLELIKDLLKEYVTWEKSTQRHYDAIMREYRDNEEVIERYSYEQFSKNVIIPEQQNVPSIEETNTIINDAVNALDVAFTNLAVQKTITDCHINTPTLKQKNNIYFDDNQLFIREIEKEELSQEKFMRSYRLDVSKRQKFIDNHENRNVTADMYNTAPFVSRTKISQDLEPLSHESIPVPLSPKNGTAAQNKKKETTKPTKVQSVKSNNSRKKLKVEMPLAPEFEEINLEESVENIKERTRKIASAWSNRS